MGKHDMVTADSYGEARIQELENQLKERDKQLAFDAETIKKLQVQCSRMSKWASEIEANAQEKLAEKDVYIALLEKALAKEAVKAVKHGI